MEVFHEAENEGRTKAKYKYFLFYESTHNKIGPELMGNMLATHVQLDLDFVNICSNNVGLGVIISSNL